MGKETVQNVLALRFANAIFEPDLEPALRRPRPGHRGGELGVEHRGGFYETAGALRDIVQNHVMQVLALTLMESPTTIDADRIRDEKVKLLRAVVIPDRRRGGRQRPSGASTRRASIDGEQVPGYREEEGVDPDSQTETYVAMRLRVDNWRWAGVPVFVRTGKRLPSPGHRGGCCTSTGCPTCPSAAASPATCAPTRCILRIQPDEGISLEFGAKVPGEKFRVRSVAMDFSYAEAFAGTDRPTATSACSTTP